jgi:hypothetical protein
MDNLFKFIENISGSYYTLMLKIAMNNNIVINILCVNSNMSLFEFNKVSDVYNNFNDLSYDDSKERILNCYSKYHIKYVEGYASKELVDHLEQYGFNVKEYKNSIPYAYVSKYFNNNIS